MRAKFWLIVFASASSVILWLMGLTFCMNLSVEQDTTTVVYGIIGAILISLAEIEFLVFMTRLGQKTLEKLTNRFSDSEADQ